MLLWLGSQIEYPAIIDAYDFNDYDIVDIGGAHGQFGLELSKRGVDFRSYTLVDFGIQIESPPARQIMAAIGERGEVVPANVLEKVPNLPGAHRLYVAKYFFHDFDDEKVKVAQRNIAKVALPGEKLLILEQVIEPGNTRPAYAETMSFIMVTHEDRGRCRTVDQHKEILGMSGFEFLRVIPTKVGISIIEAVRR